MWALWLLGCGPTYEEGMVEQGRLHCELLEACEQLGDVGYDNVGACIDDAQSQSWVECPEAAYDAEAMSACIEGWEAAVQAVDCEASPPECAPAQVCPQG